MSSFVKKQLIVFAILATSAALIVTFAYAKIPTVLGIGQMKIDAIFTDGAGLYPNANVTTRGVVIGKVKDLSLTPEGVKVEMSVDKANDIGANATAAIHSVAAVGEQFVEIQSDQPGGPFLDDGAVIPISRTTVPEQIAPVLDKTTTFLASVPSAGIQVLLDEGYKAFQNLGPDLRTLLDSGQSLIDTADQSFVPTQTFIRTSGPLLDTQVVAGNDVRSFFKDLATFTDVLYDERDSFQGAIINVTKAAGRADEFLQDNESGAGVLAEHLRTVGNVLGVYRNGLEQVLIAYPIGLAREQIALRGPNRGIRAAAVLGSYAGCTQGFKSQRMRNPNDVTDVDTPGGTYCKVPHDDKRVVRGARNIPCSEGKVGVRLAMVGECLGLDPTEQFSAAPALTRTLPATPGPNSPRGLLSPPDNQVGYDRKASGPLASMGAVGTPSSGKEQTWQSLLTAPLER